jgi:hypothetical protein
VNGGGGNFSGPASAFIGPTSTKIFPSMGFFKGCHPAKARRHSESGGLLENGR